MSGMAVLLDLADGALSPNSQVWTLTPRSGPSTLPRLLGSCGSELMAI